MSFSSDIKEKLCTIDFQCGKCIDAELAGVFRTSMREDAGALKFTTENQAVVQRVASDVKESFGICVKSTDGTKSKNLIIDDTNETENIRSVIYRDIIPFECCKASYIRGAFLGCGSVSDPNKNYHLEFCVRDKKEAQLLERLITEQGFSTKITERKGSYVVYLKGCEDIADILGYIGAPMAALELFSVQVEKEMRNNINRRVNCENANADKMAKAASKHIVAIEKIKEAGKWDKLSETLREIGDLRLEYPEESLKELGERLETPIGKSGVNHRLNRILKFAEEL